MIHRFDGEQIVRRMDLSYGRTGTALLREIRLTGIRREGGQELTEEYPPISLSYRGGSSWEPVCTRLSLDGEAMRVDPGQASLVDLYGDGLAGILCWWDGKPVYFSPNGDGQYGEDAVADRFPAEMKEACQTCRPASLEGNGVCDFVVLDPGHAGYYAQENGRFQPFADFISAPFPVQGQHTFWVDTQGDRKLHLLTTDGESCYYYPSLGRLGFAPPLRRRLPAGFTAGTADGAGKKELFADVFGDGLQHRVRVENGRVTCWPCMGYGIYGEAVVLEGAPGFADFDAVRVYFADLNGTGAEDYIYLCRDGARVYRNLGGKFERDGSFISLPVCIASEDTVYFADMDGSGCMSMVLMKADTQEVYSVHFCAGEKPGLLAGIDANMGMSCEITYRTLSDRFLEERKNGIRWKNRPWLSVQTIDSIRYHDRVTGRRQVHGFACREAWYDLEEAVFGGFGETEVRIWEEQEETGGTQEAEADTGEAYIEGSCRKYRYYIPGQQPSAYSGEPDFIEPVWEGMPGGVTREAEKALTGALLREEMYGFWPPSGQADGETGEKEGKEKLYRVTQYGFEVRELHPPRPGRRGVYYAAQRETRHFICEGGALEDARVCQEAQWNRDGYGYPGMSASVWYRRNRPRGKEQEETRILLTERSFSSRTDGACLPGILLSETEKEIRCREGLLSFEELCRFTEQAEKTERRREEFFYWDDGQKDCLSYGQTGERALLHHSRLFAFPHGFLEAFREGITEEGETELGREAGLLQDGEGWWYVSPVAVYLHGDGHYLPEMLAGLEKSEESYFCTRVSYDPFFLFAVREDTYVEGDVWNRMRAQPDYQAMQYLQTEDWNGNFREADYTPLGDLAAVSEYGSEQGKPVGDRPIREYAWTGEIPWDEVCKNPGLLLQGASAGYLTDRMAWIRGRKPVCRVEAVAMQYAGDREQAGALRQSMVQVRFYDGNLRPVEIQARDGGQWISDSRVRYGFGGEKILRYAPEWIGEPGFPDQNTARLRAEMWYDAQGRNIKLRRPKGENPSGKKVCTVFRKSEYSAWQEAHYDENDTAGDSEYGRAWEGHVPADAWEEACLRVLEKSRGFLDTPVCKWYDCQGRPVREIVGQEGGNGYALAEQDIYGRITAVGDPRLAADGKENLRVRRDNSGNAVWYESSDAGTHFLLYNRCGNLVFAGDQAGHRVHFRYDALQRLKEEWVEDAGWTKKMFYGDGLADAKEHNQAGRPVKIWDQAGEETCDGYTMAGNVLKKGRRFWKDYSADTAEHAAAGGLGQDAWTEEITYNSLGMLVARRLPDGSGVFWQYDSLGRPIAIACEKSGEGRQDVWKRISYDAAGRMRETEYGNGVRLRMETREASGELCAVSAAGPSGETLLDYRYFCDMAGNVSLICGGGDGKILWEYFYDPFYQLVSCRGREENGQGELEAYEEQFRYDGSGNLISLSHTSPSSRFEQGYPVCGGSSRLCTGQAVYNENGGLLEDGDFLKLGWDHEGNLREARIRTDKEQRTAEYYCYDYTGMRVRRVTVLEDGGVEEKRYFDGYEEKTGFTGRGEGCFRRRTIRIGGGALAEAHYDFWDRDDGGREAEEPPAWEDTYCICDHRRSVVLELDGHGEVVSREEYGAFGRSTLFWQKERQGAGKEYRFGGKEKDDYTGLYYFGSRYYDGIRFLSADGIDYLRTDRFTGMNLYSYCRNNPTTYLDPLGHCIHYFAATSGFQEMMRNYALRNSEVVSHLISSPEQFIREWNAIPEDGQSIVIIHTHGSPSSLQMGDLKKDYEGHSNMICDADIDRSDPSNGLVLEQRNSVASIIFLSCNVAKRGDWGIAGKMLEKINPEGTVIAANARVNFDRESFYSRTPKFKAGTTYSQKSRFYAIKNTENGKKGKPISKGQDYLELPSVIQNIREGTYVRDVRGFKDRPFIEPRRIQTHTGAAPNPARPPILRPSPAPGRTTPGNMAVNRRRH